MNGLQSGVFRMDDPMEYKRKILNLYLNRHTMDIRLQFQITIIRQGSQ